ncbi:hypothetical protein LCGC14_1729890 [marine sediment metagenome]|uniref:Uncharacterized protein n=1 Tax=marine sediment metagenome TaxID=412755 RepID=A0A0F9JQI1_9ZZZZ
MAVVTTGNWSFEQPPFRDGDVIEGGNCSQLVPDTEICAGVTDLTINGGNFVNCKPQSTWTINGGNWAQIQRCSHVHPEWIAKGLPADKEDCIHRDGDTKQWVEIDEKEYREHYASVSATKPQVRVAKEEDGQGVTLQRFEKEVFVYADKYLGHNKPRRAG